MVVCCRKVDVSKFFIHCLLSHPHLPVMVWLHGGGFSFGSGNAFLYGPDFLVAEDVVLVTLNYRLGPLGFLSVGGDASGNAGLKVFLIEIHSNMFQIVCQGPRIYRNIIFKKIFILIQWYSHTWLNFPLHNFFFMHSTM